MTLVVDASVIVAALTSFGNESHKLWASSLMNRDNLVSAQIAPAETLHAIRRLERRGEASPREAADAIDRLARMSDSEIQLFPAAPFLGRMWELRHNVRGYDAWYVALAESLNCPLAALDARITRASGPTCAFIVPPGNI